MQDFASSFFVAIIREALRVQGLDVPAAARDEGERAHLALAHKKALLAGVLERHGPAPLLQVGRGLPAFDGSPPARLFADVTSPEGLFDRWLRMERYFHSRHRTRFETGGDNAVRFRHFASRGAPPTAGEDIVVAGLLAALLQRLGVQAVDLDCLAPEGAWPALRNGRAAAGLPHRPAGSTACWRLAWRGAVRAPAPPTRLPVRSASGRPLQGRWQRRLFELVCDDPTGRRSLAQCATRFGLSTRTLQRRLGEEGMSFQAVIAAARLQVAAGMLSEPDMPIGLVGLLAGYSDQPHFSRQFRDGTGLTPLAYRRLAAGSSTVPSQRSH